MNPDEKAREIAAKWFGEGWPEYIGLRDELAQAFREVRDASWTEGARDGYTQGYRAAVEALHAGLAHVEAKMKGTP